MRFYIQPRSSFYLVILIATLGFAVPQANACCNYHDSGCWKYSSLSHSIPNLAISGVALLSSGLLHLNAGWLVDYIKSATPLTAEGAAARDAQVNRLENSFGLGRAGLVSGAIAVAANAASIGYNFSPAARTRWAGVPTLLAVTASAASLMFEGSFAAGVLQDSCGPLNGNQNNSFTDNPCAFSEDQLREKNAQMSILNSWTTTWATLDTIGTASAISNAGFGTSQIAANE